MGSSQDAPAWRHRAFVAYVMFMLLLFLLPLPGGPLEPARHFDKAVHAGVFLGFALLFHLDTAARPIPTFLLSLAFAGTIEVLQWILPYRDSDWWDFAAGVAGGAIGAGVVLWSAPQHPAAS